MSGGGNLRPAAFPGASHDRRRLGGRDFGTQERRERDYTDARLQFYTANWEKTGALCIPNVGMVLDLMTVSRICFRQASAPTCGRRLMTPSQNHPRQSESQKSSPRLGDAAKNALMLLPLYRLHQCPQSMCSHRHQVRRKAEVDFDHIARARVTQHHTQAMGMGAIQHFTSGVAHLEPHMQVLQSS